MIVGRESICQKSFVTPGSRVKSSGNHQRAKSDLISRQGATIKRKPGDRQTSFMNRNPTQPLPQLDVISSPAHDLLKSKQRFSTSIGQSKYTLNLVLKSGAPLAQAVQHERIWEWSSTFIPPLNTPVLFLQHQQWLLHHTPSPLWTIASTCHILHNDPTRTQTCPR